MSAFTRGEQMVSVLNALGVKASVVGNHDCDFGTEVGGVAAAAAAAGCCCRALLPGAAARCCRQVLPPGAAARCCQWGRFVLLTQKEKEILRN